MNHMNFKYYVQKFFGRLFNQPIIPIGKTTGFSLVRSERANSQFGKNAIAYTPFFLHNVIVGDYSYIAKNSNISNCTIGKFCSIGPNFCCGLGIHPTNGISTHPMFYKGKVEEYKHVTIGNDVFIGANVTVLDGVKIADGAIIGAGAVVVEDIPPYAVAVGVPAKVIKYRFDGSTIKQLLAIEWWNWDDDQLKKVEEEFFETNSFLNPK